jgi:hypothetical protein
MFLGHRTNYGFFRNGNGHNYYVGFQQKTWTQAKDFCRKLWSHQGRLVRIDNDGENKWLYNQVQKRNVWIGGNDRHRERNWVWADGCSMTYRKWSKRQPDNYKNEDCAQMVDNGNGKWNDISCNKRMGFVCKKIKTNHKCGTYSNFFTYL